MTSSSRRAVFAGVMAAAPACADEAAGSECTTANRPGPTFFKPSPNGCKSCLAMSAGGPGCGSALTRSPSGTSSELNMTENPGARRLLRASVRGRPSQLEAHTGVAKNSATPTLQRNTAMDVGVWSGLIMASAALSPSPGEIMTIRTAPDPVTGRDRPCGIDPAPGIDSLASMIAERGVSAPLVGRDFDPPRDSLPQA